MCVSNRVYTLFKKNVLAVLHCFIKMFHLQGILDSTWWNNFCPAYEQLSQGYFYLFDQEKGIFLSSYLLFA